MARRGGDVNRSRRRAASGIIDGSGVRSSARIADQSGE